MRKVVMKLKPNVLFIFTDQQHWQAAGFEDSSFNTPNIDRIAEQGTIFTNSFCTTPQCSPSRSSMLTGVYPSKTGVLGNVGAAGGEPLRMDTIGPVLQRAGYYTGYFGKWHLGREKEGCAGWDENKDWARNLDFLTEENSIGFLSRAKEHEKPFALFVSLNNPHDIYQFGKEDNPVPVKPADLPASWDKKDYSDVPAVQWEFMADDQGTAIEKKDETAWQGYREIYREKTRLVDENVGKVLDALESNGLADNALILFTSDHGDMDCNLRLIYKGPFMYEHMMRVPLIIKLPDGEEGPVSADFHTVNVDLVPTIADFADADLKETDGVSLKPLLTGEGGKPEREFVIGQYYSKQKWVNPIRMIRTAEFKYNLYQVHGEELYDLKNDPEEITNLAAKPEYADKKADLRMKLEKWIKDNDDPFFDQIPTSRKGNPVK
jgi:arylsulfatase A-like enzyme